MIEIRTQDLEKGLSIGDVSKLCSVPAYTIRYWEKEFKNHLSPVRTAGKQRRYSEEQVRRILQIKKLLWNDRFSIEGAKRLLLGFGIVPLLPEGKMGAVTDTHDLALHIARFVGNYLTEMTMAGSKNF